MHKADDIVITYTDEQRKLMDTQDINYVRFKRSLEKKVRKRNLEFIWGFELRWLNDVWHKYE